MGSRDVNTILIHLIYNTIRIDHFNQEINCRDLVRLACNRALLGGSILGNRRVLVDLALVVVERRVGDGADLAGVVLLDLRVLRWQVGADGADDGAGGVGQRLLVVCVLERGALRSVHGRGLVVRDRGRVGVGVDDIVMVRHLGISVSVPCKKLRTTCRFRSYLCICHWALEVRVVVVVLGVVRRQDGRGCANDGADLSGGHVCDVCVLFLFRAKLV